MDVAWLRLAVFAGVFAVVAIIEWLLPGRPLIEGRGRRWLTNLALVAIDAVALRLAFPIAAVGVALWAEAHHVGVLNLMALPGWLAGIIAVVLLDLAIWAQHLASHRFPLLWHIHRVHHADRDLDVTTGLRFHPLEILVSMAWKMLAVAALGAPAAAVVVFEIGLNAAAQFNHANIRLPRRLDSWLRLILVTPDFHRLHHSIEPRQTDSNYGFNLSIWDRLFGTLSPQPPAGAAAVVIGLADSQTSAPSRLGWSLLMPFRTRA